MANYRNTEKRIRRDHQKKAHNHYYAKTARNSAKKLRNINDKEEAKSFYNRVSSRLDRLAKKNIIHKNKAANLKSKLSKQVNSLS